MKRLDNRKAFTLIELLVVIAVLGILVLLAAPRFLGHTEKALHTSLIHNAKLIQDASERYHLDEDDWPRLIDEPYSSEEIENFAEKIYGITGEEVNLDPEGNYYDIDYDKLSDYVQVPDNKENYILQNPVGKVYYMENLTEVGVSRVNYPSDREEDDNPIEGEITINSAEELAKIGKPGESKYPLDGEYILTANIDLSGYSEGEGWTPVGNDDSRFTGSFDGNGYSITGLTINRPTENYVGLFGYTDGAIIENVALEGVNVSGKENVGGLVGWARNSTEISNSYVTGSVSGSSRFVGGLVGRAYNSSTITNSYATGSVTGKSNTGGLVGIANSSMISNSYATGSVESTGIQVGGLVGYASSGSIINNSYATGSVSSSENRVGGLVGYAENSTEITNSYATGSATGSWQTGGLVGNAYESTIENSYATGSVKGTETSVGGLVGLASNSTKISNSYATGEVEGDRNVGGLVGFASSITISNSYATGSVKGTETSVGGLVGYANSDTNISNSYWDRQTTGQSTSAGGGIGKTTQQMKSQATYSGWNFTNIWEITPGNYPTLR